jgi:protein-tyrosine-phosphatase
MKIVFVCRANIGRSQMAEAFFNKLSSDKDIATSAGTVLYDGRFKGSRPPRLSEIDTAKGVISSMNEESIDIGNNFGTQITSEIVENSDKVIVMAELETVQDFLKNSEKFVYWEVEDPCGKNREETNKIRDDIQNKVKCLLV